MYRASKQWAAIAAAIAGVFCIAVFGAAAATAPVITAGPTEGSTVATNTVTFVFDASGAVDIHCVFGGAPYGCASPQPFTGLGDSAYTFEVAAQDMAGAWATTTRHFKEIRRA